MAGSAGGTPRIPAAFKALKDDVRVFHHSQYLERMSRQPCVNGQPMRIAIIGGGQSAAEAFIDLNDSYPSAQRFLKTSLKNWMPWVTILSPSSARKPPCPRCPTGCTFQGLRPTGSISASSASSSPFPAPISSSSTRLKSPDATPRPRDLNDQ